MNPPGNILARGSVQPSRGTVIGGTALFLGWVDWSVSGGGLSLVSSMRARRTGFTQLSISGFTTPRAHQSEPPRFISGTWLLLRDAGAGLEVFRAADNRLCKCGSLPWRSIAPTLANTYCNLYHESPVVLQNFQSKAPAAVHHDAGGECPVMVASTLVGANWGRSWAKRRPWGSL